MAQQQIGSGQFSRSSQSARTSAEEYKSASLLPVSRIRKNDTPPHLLCDKCQAICDCAMRARLLFMTFSSTQHARPSSTRYTSGMPEPVRFSILFQWDFFGRVCLNDCQRFCSGLGMLDGLAFYECCGVSSFGFRKASR